MRIGVVLPISEEDGDDGAPPYSLVRDIAVDAEAAGLDSVWVFDHVLFRFDGVTTGIHECWTVLAAIAEATDRVELGTLVMCTGFRNAALLAKMAATLDHISDGRLILGVGAGWHDPEYEAFGWPTDHKVSRFEEALTVITDLIRHGRADLDGTYVTRARRRAAAAGAQRHADPGGVEDAADAGADRAPCRRLEPRVVRPARRAAGAHPGRAARGLRPRRARRVHARHHRRHHRPVRGRARERRGPGADRYPGRGGGRPRRPRGRAAPTT